MGGYGVEHDRAVRGDDDLQVVPQGELLQLQHEELLHPGVQTGFDFVDEHQAAVELGDLPREAEDSPFAGRHVQLRILGAAILRGEEKVPGTASRRKG